MQDFNIIVLLQRYSGDIALTSIISCLISIFLKNFLNLSKKRSIIFSFLLGSFCYIIIGKIFLQIETVIILTNAVTCGALALSLTAFFNKCLSLEKDDVKKSLEKLLSSIVVGEQLDSIVDEIVLKLKEHSEVSYDEFKELIKDNLGKDIDSAELDSVVKFIFEACGLGDDKADKRPDKTNGKTDGKTNGDEIGEKDKKVEKNENGENG